MSDSEGWRRCSTCREWIPYQHAYWICNVSTCNRKNTAFVFCSVECWDAHLPTMNHREAWAEEQRSPSVEAHARQKREGKERRAPTPARRDPPVTVEPRREPPPTVLRRPAARPSEPAPAPAVGGRLELSDDAPDEILVVASRLKDYVRARSGMNTSDRVLAPLSGHLRDIVDQAIATAHADERKTILDRDIPKKR